MNGEQPWPAYQTGKKPGSMVLNAREDGERDESNFVAEETIEQTGRRNFLQEIVGAERLDSLIDVWQMFMTHE